MTHQNNAHHALQDYLDDLLMEPQPASSSQPEQSSSRPQVATTRPVAEPDLATLEKTKRAMLQALLDRQEPKVQSPPSPVPTGPAQPEPVVAPVAEPPVETVAPAMDPERVTGAVEHYLQWHENGRPYWAQEKFDALLFDVAGLTLAVPLIALGQIQPLSGELTPLFGQANWFMGLLPTLAGQVRVVNTALFVMPERYEPSFAEGARYAVSIDGVPWALAVDAVNQPISLAPEDVKWRGERTRRPWLAGTVKSAMCALIDIPQMGHMLMTADKNRNPQN